MMYHPIRRFVARSAACRRRKSRFRRSCTALRFIGSSLQRTAALMQRFEIQSHLPCSFKRFDLSPNPRLCTSAGRQPPLQRRNALLCGRERRLCASCLFACRRRFSFRFVRAFSDGGYKLR